MNDKKDLPQNTSSFSFEASIILKIAFKWWKPLVIVAVVSALLATLFSSPSFIKPLFKSRAIVYPSNLAPYATENATEQMIQMFESEDIRNRLIREFKLFKHYNIDSAKEKYPMSLIQFIIKERIKISKTEYESAELEVFDTNPITASQICDSMISYMNQKTIEMQRTKYAEVVVISKNQLDLRKHELDSMEEVQKILRTDYGILDFQNQVKPFSNTYYKALAEGKANSGSTLDNIRKNFADKGGEYISLKEHLNLARKNYSNVKVSYDNAVLNFNKNLTFCNVVTRPFPAEKKSYPVRSLIILGFTLAMVFISFIVIVIVEKNKQK